MIDVPTATLLQEIVRRESLSLLTYVGDAFPWTAKHNDPALGRLRQIVAEHKQAVGALGKLLTRRRAALPFIGSYPSSFTAINFLALSHIQARLIEAERRAIEQLAADVPQVIDAEARLAVEKLLALKHNHQARLESLTAPPPASTPTPAAS